MYTNMIKKVQFACDVEFVSTFANEEYGKIQYVFSGNIDINVISMNIRSNSTRSSEIDIQRYA